MAKTRVGITTFIDIDEACVMCAERRVSDEMMPAIMLESREYPLMGIMLGESYSVDGDPKPCAEHAGLYDADYDHENDDELG